MSSFQPGAFCCPERRDRAFAKRERRSEFMVFAPDQCRERIKLSREGKVNLPIQF
jgi:hypothetical protein